jgi:uncharacterized protein (TIGR03067 family)
MKSSRTIKTVKVLVALAVVAVVAGVVAVPFAVTAKWVGHKDLDVRFVVTDQETDLPITDAAIHIRLEDGGGFYEGRNETEFSLVTDKQGEAHYLCKNSMCFGSKGRFEDTFAIHLPWWWVGVSAVGYVDSEPSFLDVPERQREVDRGDEQAKLVVKIALRKTPTNKAVAGSGTAAATNDTDRDRLQGRWNVVEVTPNDVDGKQAIGTILVFGPERMVEESAEAKKNKAEGGKYRLDPAKKPKHIDLLVDEDDKATFDDAKKNYIKGIYEIEGDRLKLCFAASDPLRMCIVGEANPRPVDFKTPVADRLAVMVLEREKTPKK